MQHEHDIHCQGKPIPHGVVGAHAQEMSIGLVGQAEACMIAARVDERSRGAVITGGRMSVVVVVVVVVMMTIVMK